MKLKRYFTRKKKVVPNPLSKKSEKKFPKFLKVGCDTKI